MKFLTFGFLILIAFFIFPITITAHPGGGLIALDENTVIFGDSTYNAVWRLKKGKKAHALMKNFHAHWTTLGLDGNIYWGKQSIDTGGEFKKAPKTLSFDFNFLRFY